MTLDRRFTRPLTTCFLLLAVVAAPNAGMKPCSAGVPPAGTVLSTALVSLAAEPTGSTAIVVDDFESYTNNSSRRLYETWIDGIGYPGHAGNGSGAMVGHDIWARGTRYATIAETSLVHGGKQSMPVYYDNVTAPFYSEVERTFATPQDWTAGGINTLSLWLRGAASNAADPLYVALEDATGTSKITVRSDSKALQAPEWRHWQLDLKAFSDAGVNLQSIKRLRLGVGDRQNPKASGTGIIYVDDITAGITTTTREGSCGSIVAWGSNLTGQTNVPTGKDFTTIAAGAYFSLALRTDGSIVAWGSNSHGQRNVPTGKGFRAIAAGNAHGVAAAADGSLVGWGSNDYRQATPPAGNDFVAVAAGDGYSIALRADGSLVGWGNNNPWRQATPPAGSSYTAISAGSNQGQALRASGSIITWGVTGEIHFFNGVEYVHHFYGFAASGNDFIAVAGGRIHGLALKADGSVVAWGTCDAPPTAKGFVAIAAGGDHDLALKADGSIVGWGRSDYGQADPPAGTGFIAIAAGAEHSLAIKEE